MRGILTRNLGLKTLALFISVLLWVFVTGESHALRQLLRLHIVIGLLAARSIGRNDRGRGRRSRQEACQGASLRHLSFPLPHMVSQGIVE